MRFFIVFALIILILIIYLNRSYSYFYSYIGSKNLYSPYKQSTFNFNYKQNATPFKYVALGDSLTAGVGSKDFNTTFPYLIAESLSKKYSSVTLINLAISGSETKEVLNYQVPKAIQENPDYITLLTGINDIHNFTSEDKFKADYQMILEELTKKTKAKIIVLNIPYLGSSKTVFFPYTLLLDYKTKQFNKDIESISYGDRLKYIDLYSQTKQFSLDENYYSEDLFHPSAYGYILWQKIIDAN